MDSPQASVLVVEKHPLMREAICAAIQEDPLLTVAGQFPDVIGNRPSVHSAQANVFLFSVEYLSWTDIEEISNLGLTAPDTPILVITNPITPEQESALSSQHQPIRVLPKASSCNEIIQTLIQLSGVFPTNLTSPNQAAMNGHTPPTQEFPDLVDRER